VPSSDLPPPSASKIEAASAVASALFLAGDFVSPTVFNVVVPADDCCFGCSVLLVLDNAELSFRSPSAVGAVAVSLLAAGGADGLRFSELVFLGPLPSGFEMAVVGGAGMPVGDGLRLIGTLLFRLLL